MDEVGDEIFATAAYKQIPAVSESSISAEQVLFYLYFLGLTFFLGRLIVRMVNLRNHLKNPFIEVNGLRIIAKGKGFTNCSFFNYVFIDKKHLSDAEISILLAHEQAHATHLHSIDRLIIAIVKAILWLNPAVYFYDYALEEIHEFEADRSTSDAYGKNLYANVLLAMAVNSIPNSLAYLFARKPIKSRIKMLFNNKSNSMKKLFYLLALPIGLVLLMSFTVKFVSVPVMQELPKKKVTTALDSLFGKQVKGTIMGFERVKYGERMLLKVGDRVVKVGVDKFRDKLETGKQIVVVLSASSTPPVPIGEKPKSNAELTYYTNKVWDANMNVLYTYVLEKNAAGKVKLIVLNDGDFTINFKVEALGLASIPFSIGEKVNVRFIGETKINNNEYTTDKLIAMYGILQNDSKTIYDRSRSVINEALYSKFYFPDGKQKVYNASKNRKPLPRKGGNLTAVPNGQRIVGFDGDKVSMTDLKYSASDSIVRSPALGVVTLYGNAKLYDNQYLVSGDKISIDYKAKKKSTGNL